METLNPLISASDSKDVDQLREAVACAKNRMDAPIATNFSAGTIDSFMAPLTIDEKKDPIGPCPNQTRKRCSDKGFLSMSLGD